MPIFMRQLKRAGSLVSHSDSKQIVSGYVVLRPGEEVGEHKTGGGEELITFLEGTAEVSFGKKTTTVQSPAVVLTPAHTLHNVSNKTKKPLKYVYTYVMAMDVSDEGK